MRPLPFLLLVPRVAFLGGLLVIHTPGLHAQATATDGPTVMLPPMMVEERGIPLQWRYVGLPRLEILSVCDERTTTEVVRRLRRLDALLSVILPERFMARTAVPETLILVDEKAGQAHSREVIAEIVRQGRTRVQFLPNIRLMDVDATTVFTVVRPASPASFTYATDRIAYFTERRTPHLPDWFLEGMLGFYEQLELADREIVVRSAAFRSDPERPRTLLPMEEFFARSRNRTETPDLDAVWRAQCALFVRWAVVENNAAHREALWKFIDRLEQEPMSEALLREHFGQGYSDLRDELSDYLSSTARQRTTIAVPPTPIPRPAIRPATELEVARIRGDWERMEIAYVRQRSPAYVEKYVDRARRTLRRAYDRGERDPRLLASLGLTELDAGDPDAARPLLEAAVEGRVVRPRAYYELARLRFEAAVKETGANGKFSAQQTADAIAPLLAAHRQEPPLPQNYALITRVLARSDTPPTSEQLIALHEGARNFPQVSELVLRVAIFHLANDQPTAAATLTEIGLRHARDPAMRARLARLPLLEGFGGAKR
ncbi:MAG: hypothetical protein ABIZ49_02620 [Opitutaceae bacterium]